MNLQLMESSWRAGARALASPAAKSTDMGKLIQICASQNDLFALDEEVEVFQYNFNTKTWVKLVLNPSQKGIA